MIRRSIFIVFLFFLVGCSTTENQNYVKNLMISFEDGKYCFTVECYDFSTSQENYIYEKYCGSDLDQLCINVTRNRNFNYRLCENIYITANMFDGNISKIIYSLNRLKIPVTANIMCYASDTLPENNVSGHKLIGSAVFDLIDNKNKITGFVQFTDKDKNNKGAVLVSDGVPVKLLNENQWNIFNIFTGKTKDFSFVFRDGTIYCKLENCKVMHSFDGSLNLNIYASLKDYKGINNYITSENFMKELLENEIRDTAYELYNDTLITDNSNLHWYCIQSGEKCDGVNINVFII